MLKECVYIGAFTCCVHNQSIHKGFVSLDVPTVLLEKVSDDCCLHSVLLIQLFRINSPDTLPVVLTFLSVSVLGIAVPASYLPQNDKKCI